MAIDFLTSLRAETFALLGKEEIPVGAAGTTVVLKAAGRLPLGWNLRVVDEEGEALEAVPYSLYLLSSCCERSLREQPGGGVGCGACKRVETWAVTGERLSLLSPTRAPATISILAAAISHFWPEVDPFTAVLEARNLADAMEEVSAEVVGTPAHANLLAQVSRRPE